MAFAKAFQVITSLCETFTLGLEYYYGARQEYFYEHAQQDEQERQSRLSLETAKVQELTQAKGNYLDNNFRKFYLLTLVLNIWLFMVYRRV
jgi:hypothetical protein